MKGKISIYWEMGFAQSITSQGFAFREITIQLYTAAVFY